MSDFDFATADLLADDPEIKEIRDRLDEARRRKSGYYLLDEHTGEKIYMTARQIEDCRAIHQGLADKWCDVCVEDVEAIVCMWKAEFGNPFDNDSWAHYCATHARQAGLLV